MPRFAIDIDARFAKFQDSLTSIEKSSAKTAGKISAVFKTAGLAIGAIAGGLIVGRIASGFRSIVDELDAISKRSQATGVIVEELSALGYGAELSAVSIQELDKALIKLSSNAADAARGTGEAKEAFGTLGIDVTQFDQVSDLLEAVADKFSVMEDGLQKTSLSAEIFGQRIGGKLIPFLNQGSKGFAANAEEAKRFGAILDGDAARAAETFNDNITRLGFITKGLFVSSLGPLIQGLANLTEGFRKASAEGRGFYEAIKGAFAIGFLNDAVGDIERVLGQLDKAKRKLAAQESGVGRLFNAREIESSKKQIEGLTNKLFELQDALQDRKNRFNELVPPVVPSKKTIGGGGSEDPATPKKKSEGQRILESLRSQAIAASKLSVYEATIRKIEEERIPIGKKLLDLIKERARSIDANAAERITIETIERLKAETSGVEQLKEAERELYELRKKGGSITGTNEGDIRALVRQKQLLAEGEALASAREEDQFATDDQTAQKIQELQAAANAYKDLIDPMRAMQRELKIIDDLVARGGGLSGGLTEEEGNAARSRVYALTASLKELGKEATETDKILERMVGQTAGAFADAIVGAEDFDDALKQIAIDLAKLIIQQAAFKALSGVIGFATGANAETPGNWGSNLTGALSSSAPVLSKSVAPVASAAKSVAAITNYNTYNIPADVSMSQVERAVARGGKQVQGSIYDARLRGATV